MTIQSVRRHVRRLLNRPRLTRQSRLSLIAATTLGVVGVGILDAATGRDVSFAVIYMLPVIIGTIFAGTPVGVALAVASATAWVIADAVLRDDHVGWGVSVLNGCLRAATLLLVVGLVATLRKALESAQSSERLSREFLALAAHQLRTPIAGIRTSAEAMLARGAAGANEALLLNVANEAARAGNLVRALLQIARLDLGEPLPLAPTDLPALCERELTRSQSASPGLQWRFSESGPTLGSVNLNEDAISEAVANLLDNARRHAETTVEVVLRWSGDTVLLEVFDDGPGVPDADRAFERFVSLDGRGGLGLGLPLSRGFVERLGGRLLYENHRFLIELPTTLR